MCVILRGSHRGEYTKIPQSNICVCEVGLKETYTHTLKPNIIFVLLIRVYNLLTFNINLHFP